MGNILMAKAGRRLISNKDQWQKILTKIAPLTEANIVQCLNIIDAFFVGVDQMSKYNKTLTILLEKHPCLEDQNPPATAEAGSQRTRG